MFEHPDVLHVSSAGNTGNQYSSPFNTVGAPASCKNVFAVGATNNAEFGSGTSYVVDFSSRGPTSDGRTKPDIMAPGYALDSAGAGITQCATQEPVYLKAGTSMATPVVAGASALVRQYFLDGYYPCGSKSCSTSISPSGALVKAVLANGAQPLKGVQVGGTTTVINSQYTKSYDNTQNMGISNLLTSLPLKNENDFSIFIQNDAPIKSGQGLTFDFVINKSDGRSADFAATIAWYDPPATNGCTKCLSTIWIFWLKTFNHQRSITQTDYLDQIQLIISSVFESMAVNSDYPTGSIFASDDAISLYSGVGKGLNFGATWRHRQMNGAVYYSITN
jgi:hypothetical protein